MTILACANLTMVTVLLLIWIFFVTIDTGLGRLNARRDARKNGKEERLAVTSKKTRLGVSAKLLLFFTIMIPVVLADYFFVDVLFFYFKNDLPFHYLLTSFMLLIFISWEVDSVDEHFYRLTGFTVIKKIKETFEKGKNMILGLLKAKNEIKDENDGTN